MVDYDENGFTPSGGENGRKCPECGEEVNGKFRFCPACGTAIPEMPAQVPFRPGTAVSRQEPVSREQPIPRRSDRFSNNGNEPDKGRRFRTNADRTEASFREFNAVARPRRRKDDRKSAVPLIMILLVFLNYIGGGV